METHEYGEMAMCEHGFPIDEYCEYCVRVEIEVREYERKENERRPPKTT